jgi:hypothetical protein
MATEINIATYDENGVPVCRPMTDAELAELQEMQKIESIVPLLGHQ